MADRGICNRMFLDAVRAPWQDQAIFCSSLTRILLLLLLLATAMPAETRRVVAISHRGEHLHHPENTMPAFQEAIRLGAGYIEVDVRTTADGKLILSHDGTVNRCTNGQGDVARMTFDELRALDAGIKSGPEYAGTRMPSFDEVLDLARGKIDVYVDVKQVSARDLVAHIQDHGMSDHVGIYSGRISNGIQTDRPGELVQYLREKGYKK